MVEPSETSILVSRAGSGGAAKAGGGESSSGGKRGFRVIRGDLRRAILDHRNLRINEVANAPVIADLAQAPGDLADHPRTLAHGRKFLLERQSVECLHCGGLRRRDRVADRSQRLFQPIVFNLGGDSLALRGEALLEPGHRVQHQTGIGIAVALGIFGEEPATPRGLHEGFADRGVIFLAGLHRAGGNRRKGECFVGHMKPVA
jgi:hypothetical protein